MEKHLVKTWSGSCTIFQKGNLIVYFRVVFNAQNRKKIGKK